MLAALLFKQRLQSSDRDVSCSIETQQRCPAFFFALPMPVYSLTCGGYTFDSMSFTIQMICDLPFHNPTVVSQLNVKNRCVIAYVIFIEAGCKFRCRLSRKHFLMCLFVYFACLIQVPSSRSARSVDRFLFYRDLLQWKGSGSSTVLRPKQSG